MQANRNSILLLIAFLLASSPRAFAYGNYSSNNDNSEYALSTGAGIASPGATASLFENPAGLIYNASTKFEGFASSGDSNLSPANLGGLAFLGNGSVGASIGAQTSTASGSGAVLDYGLAATIPSSDISIGLGGTYQLTYGSSDAWGLNAGALFNAHGSTRFGATVYDLTNGVSGFGAGAAFDLSPDATFAIDGGADKNFNGKTLTPGLQVRVAPVELMFSYGIDIDNNGASPIPRGTTLGLGVRVTDTIHLIGYYNELDTYFLALTARL